MIRPAAVFVTITIVLASAGSAAAPAGRPTKTGHFPFSFAQRSPHSAAANIATRLGWRRDGGEDYDLAKESFQLYVPTRYKDDGSYGLFVWVSPGDSPRVRPDWYPLFDRHKLIFIGANRSGNEREVLARVGLALDAAFNMQRVYKLDSKRIYIGGLSGGGRVSSMTAMSFPEEFGGGYYIIGCNFYRDVPVIGEPRKLHPRSFTPTATAIAATKSKVRHVLLTGERDMNRPQTQANFQAMSREGFKFVQYFEVPGMEHQAPPAEWFEKGLIALHPASPLTRPAR